MSNILGIDVGYGDIKVVYGPDKDPTKLFKFNSVVGLVNTSTYVTDPRVYPYLGSNYYIGKLALSLESGKIIDIIAYEKLEMYSPLLIKYVIDQLKEVPDIIVCGLSIAQIANSGHYKDVIHNYLVSECKMPIKRIVVIPQGIGGKLCFDKYGLEFPKHNESFADYNNYVGVDIGFQTLDVFQVMENKTSPNLIRGLENQGLVKIVFKLLKSLSEQYGSNVAFTLKEGKDILDNGNFKVRGNEFNVSKLIESIKKEYLTELTALIEDQFGTVLNKMDFIRLFGGGAYVFKDIKDSFIQVPKSRAEYYNAIGNYIRGCIIAKDNS
jgi:hypothetical protein